MKKFIKNISKKHKRASSSESKPRDTTPQPSLPSCPSPPPVLSDINPSHVDLDFATGGCSFLAVMCAWPGCSYTAAEAVRTHVGAECDKNRPGAPPKKSCWQSDNPGNSCWRNHAVAVRLVRSQQKQALLLPKHEQQQRVSPARSVSSSSHSSSSSSSTASSDSDATIRPPPNGETRDAKEEQRDDQDQAGTRALELHQQPQQQQQGALLVPRSSRATTTPIDRELHFCAWHKPPASLTDAFRKGRPYHGPEWLGPYPGPFFEHEGQTRLCMARWEARKVLWEKEKGRLLANTLAPLGK